MFFLLSPLFPLFTFYQECANPSLLIPQVQRDIALKALSDYSVHIVKLLHGFITNSGNDRVLQKKILETFLSWMKHGGIEVTKMENDPLILITFQAVACSELIPIAADVIYVILKSSKDPIYLNFQVFMMKKILELPPLFGRYHINYMAAAIFLTRYSIEEPRICSFSLSRFVLFLVLVCL